MKKCAECGAAASDNSQFCRSCGAKIEAEVISDDIAVCKNCREPIEADEQFCSNCGQPVSPIKEQSDELDEPEQAANEEADDKSEEHAAVNADSEETVNIDEHGEHGADDSPGVVLCPKCGSDLSDDAVFCRNCGHNIRLSQQSSAVAARPASSYMPPPPPPAWQSAAAKSQPAEPEKRKSKGLLIALIILLIVAVLAGAVYLLAGPMIRRLIMGNKATYMAIEGQQLRQDAADLAEWLAEIGDSPQKPAIGGHNVQFNIELNDNAAIDPVLQTTLENITWRSKVMYDLEASPEQYYAELELLTASEPLLLIEGYYDEEQLIVGLPGIISQHLWAQRSTIDDYAYDMGLDADETDQAFGMLDLLLNLDMGIDEPAMRQSLLTYIDIMLSHIDQVEFSAKQDLSVGPVNEKYDRFTMNISGENTYLMIREILEVMRSDTEIYKLVSSMSELGQSIDSDSFDTPTVLTLEQWQQSIDTLIEELNNDYETAEPFTIVQEIYVDKNNRIFGRDLKILDQAGSVSFRFENYRPEADDQAAVLVRITSEDEEMEYRNIYQLVDEKRDGKLSISSSNQPFAEIEYSQYERVAVGSRSYILGDFTITLHDQSEYGSPTAIQYQGALNDGQIEIKLGMPELGSIQISYQEITQDEVVMPSFSSDQLLDVNDTQALAGLMTEETMNELYRIIDQLGLDPGILYE